MSRSYAGMACEARQENITFWSEKMLWFARNAEGPLNGWGSPSYRGGNMDLLCPEDQEMLLNILHAINLFRSEQSHQFVRIQAKSVVQAMPTVCPSWTVKNTFIHVEDEDLAIVLKINQFLVAFQFPCECLHFYFASDTSMHLSILWHCVVTLQIVFRLDWPCQESPKQESSKAKKRCASEPPTRSSVKDKSCMLACLLLLVITIE